MKTEALRLTTTIPVAPTTLYYAWLDSAQHSAMTGGVSEIVSEVGAKHSSWNGYITGKMIALDLGRRIVMSWRTTDFPTGASDSRVELHFEALGGNTRLLVLHTDIPEGQGEKYRTVWNDKYFLPLRTYFAKALPDPRLPPPVRKPPPPPEDDEEDENEKPRTSKSKLVRPSRPVVVATPVKPSPSKTSKLDSAPRSESAHKTAKLAKAKAKKKIKMADKKKVKESTKIAMKKKASTKKPAKVATEKKVSTKKPAKAVITKKVSKKKLAKAAPAVSTKKASKKKLAKVAPAVSTKKASKKKLAKAAPTVSTKKASKKKLAKAAPTVSTKKASKPAKVAAKKKVSTKKVKKFALKLAKKIQVEKGKKKDGKKENKKKARKR